MVRWLGIIRAVIRVVIPVLVLFSPIYISLIYVGYLFLFGYSITTDHLLAIIILFQTYIILIQVEIALRQTAVFQTEYNPTFKVKIDDYIKIVSLENVGDYPAYNVMIALLDMTTKKRIDEPMRLNSKASMTLAPEESMNILSMDSQEYRNMKIRMEICYNNVLDESRDITFVKFPKTNDFMLIHAPTNIRRGILLKSLEDLKLIYLLLRYWRHK